MPHGLKTNPTPDHAPRAPLWERRRPAYEKAVFAAIALGTLLALLGTLGASVDRDGVYEAGLGAAVAGVFILLGATVLGRPLLTYRWLYRRSSGGNRYDQLKRWTRLKTVSILLNLLTGAAVLLLLASLAFRLEPLAINAPFPLVLRLTTLFALVLLAVASATHHLSLRTPIERPEETSGFEGVFLWLGVAATVVFGLLAAVLASRPLDIAGLVRLRVVDAPFFLLAASTAACVTLFLARSLPTVYNLLVEDRSFYTGHQYLSRSKSVMLPAAMALGLLFLVVLVLLVFGLGLASLVEEVPRNTVLIGVFGFIVVAMAASVGVTLMLSKREDRATLYRRARTAEAKRSLAILGGSTVAATVLLIVSASMALGGDVAGLDNRLWLDFFAFALLAALGPYGFYVATKYKRVRQLEERFPDFLRDLAASRKAGLTLNESVTIASHGEYGALTPEIVKMSDQLSWNVPFDEALTRFGERVHTPLVQRATSLINEASRTGGNVTDVLLAAARDAREIKNLETERRTTMGMYTIIIYVTFFVFLGVAAVLYGTFIPEILKTSNIAKAGSFGGMTIGQVTLEDYRVFYFLASLMQGLGNGFVGGLMGSGKPLDGLRHAFVMVLITYLTFALLLSPG